MRVMLTGAGGMLAHALRDSVTAHIELIALTRDQLDIGDRRQVERVVSSIRPHVIVNAAAYSKVDAAESVPQTADQVNGHALGFLAEAALMSLAHELMKRPIHGYCWIAAEMIPNRCKRAR